MQKERRTERNVKVAGRNGRVMATAEAGNDASVVVGCGLWWW